MTAGEATQLTATGSRVVLPKAARVVADTLRERILTKQFEAGSHLPAAEALIEEFGVSPRRCARPSTSSSPTA